MATSNEVPFPKKIHYGRQWLRTHHRSGWPYAIGSLASLHAERGVILDGFIEKKFAWGRDPGDRYNCPAPYYQPWIGILHNPPYIPDWFNLNPHHPAQILRSPMWEQSIKFCLGLFTLSAYLKRWLQQHVSVPVCSLLHPTDASVPHFSMDAFVSDKPRRVVQVGWWLRKSHSFFSLDAPLHAKILLNIGQPFMNSILETECSLLAGRKTSPVCLMPYLDDASYDQVLASSVVFLDLYDSSANNAIVECIVRHTPVLVNPLEAVQEYLGEHYPLYFHSLDEAAELLRNNDRIEAASRYLAQLSRSDCFTSSHFRQAFASSSIYSALPAPPSD